MSCKIYLVLATPWQLQTAIKYKSYFNLVSFEYIRKNKLDLSELNKHTDLLLDSGVFSFLQNPELIHKVDLDRYVNAYAEYIVKHNIEKAFEIDLYDLIGIEKIERLREVLLQTGKQLSIRLSWERWTISQNPSTRMN